MLSHRARIDNILFLWTVSEDFLFVDPVFHVGAGNLITLIAEEEGGHCAVDSSREGDENFF